MEHPVQVFNYEDTPVTFSLGSNVMVNATEMAKPFDKQAKDWLKTAQAKELIDAIAERKNVLSVDLVIVNKGNFSELAPQGTWMHEDIALAFAQWLSPKFYVWCLSKLKELLTTGSTQLAQAPAQDTLMLTNQALKAVTEHSIVLENANAKLEERCQLWFTQLRIAEIRLEQAESNKDSYFQQLKGYKDLHNELLKYNEYVKNTLFAPNASRDDLLKTICMYAGKPGSSYEKKDNWLMLYKAFEESEHIDFSRRQDLRRYRSKLDYIEKKLGKLQRLAQIAYYLNSNTSNKSK